LILKLTENTKGHLFQMSFCARFNPVKKTLRLYFIVRFSIKKPPAMQEVGKPYTLAVRPFTVVIRR